MKRAIRRAEDRLADFEALAAFANLPVIPRAWAKFRHKYPNFFPSDLAIARGVRITAGNPKGKESTVSDVIYDRADLWAKNFLNERYEVRSRWTTPLLWYRDALRLVWRGDDRNAACLYIL
jgi:hypothetical protein